MSLLDHLTPHVPWRPSHRLSPVEAALGVDHPLCQSERELTSAVAQLAGTAVFVGSVASFARFQAVGVILFVGALTLTGVSIRVGTAVFRRQLQTIDAIAAGLENVPSAHVRRVRARLLGRRERERIAHALAAYLPAPAAARSRGRLEYVPPPTATDGAEQELREVIALLRGDAPSEARGVALCHRLVWDYPSPLFSEDATTLRAQLGRIRFLLSR